MICCQELLSSAVSTMVAGRSRSNDALLDQDFAASDTHPSDEEVSPELAVET